MTKQEFSLFYIYTPAWRENAAGIRVLHYLCDALNQIGCQAFLVLHNPFETPNKTNPKLQTPILTQELSDKHFKEQKIPTVIYSETIPGNPLKATRVVRYLLNYPGALGGPTTFNEKELLFSYTKSIQEKTIQESSVLFLPAVKRGELPSAGPKDPNLRLIYAGKFRAFVGPPPKITDLPIVEIYRDGPFKQDRAEVLDLLSRASVLYLWENSSIATEAILLNTPCVFIKNGFLGEIIASAELGLDGTTFSDSQQGLLKAQQSLPQAKAKYIEAEKEFWNQLHLFVDIQKSFFANSSIRVTKIRVPKSKHVINRHRITLFLGMLQNIGLLKTLRVTKEFARIRIRKNN